MGEPGAGKTTWARQLAWRLASGTASPEALGLPDGLRPVLLRLRNLTTDDLAAGLSPLLSLKSFLQRETRSDGAPAGQQDPSEDFWNSMFTGYPIRRCRPFWNVGSRLRTVAWMVLARWRNRRRSRIQPR